MSNAIAAKNMAIKLKIVQETRISKRIKDQMMKFKELSLLKKIENFLLIRQY
jgi:hypothetical protein